MRDFLRVTVYCSVALACLLTLATALVVCAPILTADQWVILVAALPSALVAAIAIFGWKLQEWWQRPSVAIRIVDETGSVVEMGDGRAVRMLYLSVSISRGKTEGSPVTLSVHRVTIATPGENDRTIAPAAPFPVMWSYFSPTQQPPRATRLQPAIFDLVQFAPDDGTMLFHYFVFRPKAMPTEIGHRSTVRIALRATAPDATAAAEVEIAIGVQRIEGEGLPRRFQPYAHQVQ